MKLLIKLSARKKRSRKTFVEQNFHVQPKFQDIDNNSDNGIVNDLRTKKADCFSAQSFDSSISSKPQWRY